MDLQTMGDNALTSEDAPSIDNLRAHSPQTAGDSRPQPDTPIGLEESWRNANSCARCRSPAAPSRMRIGCGTTIGGGELWPHAPLAVPQSGRKPQVTAPATRTFSD